MSGPKAQKIVVEFEDGSIAEASYDTLPRKLQLELLRQPFASQPSLNPEQEKFVLLEWDDGWKEVIEVDIACSEINRYYVISRPEDVGRLSLNKQDSYPELIEIVRKPMDLKKITFLNTFQLCLERSHREGKKTDHFFVLSQENNALSDEIKAFKKAVAESGIDLKQIRSQDPGLMQEQYEVIRRKMGLKAVQRQQDVWDFIAYLTRISD